ncbi:hypothetical protein ABIB40_004214 [Pedobacter sp. UYP30]
MINLFYSNGLSPILLPKAFTFLLAFKGNMICSLVISRSVIASINFIAIFIHATTIHIIRILNPSYISFFYAFL